MRILISKSMMPLIAGVVIVPVLGACSLGPKQYDVSSSPAPVSTQTTTATTDNLGNAPGLQPVQQFPVPSDRDLRVMTTKLSGGAVEIYDIDNGGSTAGAVSSSYPAVSSEQIPSGVPLAKDPRVTVYPLDGGEFDAGVYGGTSYYQEPAWPVSSASTASAGLPTGSHVYFDHGSANVTGSGKRVVSDAAETSKFAPVDRVSVEGHASSRVQTSDPIRGRILNLKESMNRAFEVSKDLIEQGVPAEKIKTVGWGDTKQDGDNEAQQRRVDIVTGQ